MSKNGQTHFKNLAAFPDHFGTLFIKVLITYIISTYANTFSFHLRTKYEAFFLLITQDFLTLSFTKPRNCKNSRKNTIQKIYKYTKKI